MRTYPRLIVHDARRPGVIYTSDDPVALVNHINETVRLNQEERKRLAAWRDMNPQWFVPRHQSALRS